jgi:hypothetical protein
MFLRKKPQHTFYMLSCVQQEVKTWKTKSCVERKRGDKIMLEFIVAFYVGKAFALAVIGFVSWFFIEVVGALVNSIINLILSIPTMIADWFTNTVTAILSWIANIPTEILNWVTTLL